MLPQEKINQLLDRHKELETQMSSNPDQEAYVKMAQEFSALGPVIEKIKEMEANKDELMGLAELLADSDTDAEMKAMAEEEMPMLKETIEKAQDELQILLLPKDAADDRSVILEVRAGTGG